MVIPFLSLVVGTSEYDQYLALPNAGWVNQIIPGGSDPENWPKLDDVKAESWLTDEENNFVNRRMTRTCGDFFLCDRDRIVLHVRREPGGGEPFPTVAKAAINGALWPSGGMMAKPAGNLDGKLSPAATLLLKARKELANVLTRPEQVVAIHHAGVGFTTFQAKSQYRLADGSVREVELASGKASVTFQETCFLRVVPSVINRLTTLSAAEDSQDFADHLVVTRNSWPNVRPYCLDYVIEFVQAYFDHASNLV